ncbi:MULTISPECIES: peptidase domain-containing ABC transporter [Pseudoalteromonas]|uniref:Peptidase domain-containing ABC transporter n=1 Tax=Pseudoalteromonas maricaloris TaxID=184924 RepID=A0A8I2H2K7_9GAMM|nr:MULTISPECIES: peptidase domain-containing ABC transporter [Pseudoalteromonas]KID37137.1 ABC transporter ATP-binding protein [Pseudoalteromonas flavipulchra NCIMB 2033 = ATCC BAA-314]MBD0782944.1 peptidase domain-containing ABC transporter [Pseudoalteromonas flavipulchra]MBE0374809.1 ATP-binding cassette, subfamily B, bacterial RaxB [Pseudoalteromonas flavipulchra NCIMB 2033 = ATCC BAA-314]NLR21918.1 peptidase domain-containing ABC transporter [Pseudoalteromonas maricaloris]RZG13188.1 peptid
MEMEHEGAANKLEFWSRKSLPVIIQSEAAECGLASLAMVAGYHGYRTDLTRLRQRFSISIEGCTLLDIMHFAEKLHLTSRPLRIELEDLDALQTPAILHWNMNHFVVLKKANEKRIVIHDPAGGEKTFTMEEASKHFTGVALELTPTKDFEKKEQKASLRFSDFWSRITGLKRSLLLIFMLSILLQVFTLAAPYYIQLVIDDVILTGDTSLLTVLAIGFFLVLLFEIATNALRGFTLLHFGNQMNIQLGANLFHHLVRLPIAYFEKRHMGDVVSRFGSLQQVKQLLTTGVIEAIIDGLMAIITLAMIFFYSPMLSAVVLVAVITYAIIRMLMYKPFRNISEQEIMARAEENSNFMETVRGIQTIKLFGSEVKREGQWQNRYASAINHNIRLGNFKIGYDAINRALFGIENIIVVYLAAHLVIAGGFSTGMLFAFMSYKRQFMDKTANLIEKLIEFKMLGLHFDRIADIALTDKEELQPDQYRKLNIEGKIEVKNLSFAYSDATPNVIDKLSLTINAGESVAITGPSGCGKSTLLKLMLGLNKPSSGEILVDGISLSQIGARQYRQQIAAVMQDDELLSGTVADNIAFFDSPINMEKVVHCAQLAAIHDDISDMPMGYDSLIGDMGSSLSGGQKQRIILARALYKDPKILFMDEATSHLDTGLEEDINDAVSRLKITRIIIAHRKETIASADREIKLKKPVHHEGEEQTSTSGSE